MLFNEKKKKKKKNGREHLRPLPLPAFSSQAEEGVGMNAPILTTTTATTSEETIDDCKTGIAVAILIKALLTCSRCRFPSEELAG